MGPFAAMVKIVPEWEQGLIRVVYQWSPKYSLMMACDNTTINEEGDLCLASKPGIALES